MTEEKSELSILTDFQRTAIKCWNAYINEYAQEPQTGTQFQRWVSNSEYHHHVNYSKAYQIYDAYTGTGIIELLDPIETKQSIQSRDVKFVPSQIPHGTHYNSKNQPRTYHHEQQQQHFYPSAQHNTNNHHYNNGHKHQMNEPHSRSRTHTAHQRIKLPQNTMKPRRRSKTFSTKADLKVDVHPYGGGLTPVSRHIKALSLSPKVAADIIPKDDLTLFCIEYDIKDLKRKLKENQIQLRHLETLEHDDLNELCTHLKLSIPEKVRFKFAVKDTQQKLRHGMNAPYTQTSLRQSQPEQYSLSPAILSDDDYDDAYHMDRKNVLHSMHNRGHEVMCMASSNKTHK